MRGAITSLLRRGSEEDVIAECRRCGTSTESTASTCSTCGCEEIVTYTIQ